MIHLVTGVPGSGKTLYTVWWLEKQVKAGRRLVVNGVKGLLLDHEMVDDEWIRDWHNRVQPNDIVVVDEVQRIWPPVPAGAKPTADVEALHIHRHKGVDFVVITQHPNRMNKTIRDLVGRHLHVRRLFGLSRAMLYEWDSAHNPNAGFRDAVKTVWKYPRHIYELYVSAELHTKPKAVYPKALFIVPIALVFGVYFAWKGFHGVTGFGSTVQGNFGGKAASQASGASSVSAGSAGAAAGASEAVSTAWRVAGQYVVDGVAYVLLVDAAGRFRSELAGEFSGKWPRVEARIESGRVSGWSGGAIDAGVRK